MALSAALQQKKTYIIRADTKADCANEFMLVLLPGGQRTATVTEARLHASYSSTDHSSSHVRKASRIVS